MLCVCVIFYRTCLKHRRMCKHTYIRTALDHYIKHQSKARRIIITHGRYMNIICDQYTYKYIYLFIQSIVFFRIAFGYRFCVAMFAKRSRDRDRVAQTRSTMNASTSGRRKKEENTYTNAYSWQRRPVPVMGLSNVYSIFH